MLKNNPNRIFGLTLTVCLFIIFIFSPVKARAASLYFSPSVGSFIVGDIFSTELFVDTAGAAINNAEAAVNFPTEFLEVISISQAASIFSLWIQPVSYSNSAGTITFNGGLPTPGYTGSSGRIFSVVFRTKKTGAASLILSSASIRANDGLGTDILTSANSAQYNLSAPLLEKKAPLPPPPPPPSLPLPDAPKIISPTHPDQQKWYAQKEAKFSWPLPAEVNAVRLLADTLPATSPNIVYSPPINVKELTNLGDGVWYFHAQFRNQAGWGKVSHYRFQIDNVPPEPFAIKFIDGRETDNSRPNISFAAEDALSGIDYYKVKIDEGEFNLVYPEAVAEGKPYSLPFQEPGKKTILVQAFDRAGNNTGVKDELTVMALTPPEFTDYPKALRSDEILIAKGETQYPGSQIVVWLANARALYEQVVRSGDDGLFIFVAEEKLSAGSYQLWAEMVDERGVRSAPSEKLTIVVTKVLSCAFIILAIVAPLIIIILILLFQLYRVRRKLRAVNKKTRVVKKN